MGANGDSQPRCRTLRALLTHPPSQKHRAWRKSRAEHTQILGSILYGQATVGDLVSFSELPHASIRFLQCSKKLGAPHTSGQSTRAVRGVPHVLARTLHIDANGSSNPSLTHKPKRISSFWRGLKGSNFSRVYSHAHPQLSQRANSRRLVLKLDNGNST